MGKDLVAIWVGESASVNDWHGARAVRQGMKWKAVLYEKAKYRKFKESVAIQVRKQIRENTVGHVDLTMIVYLRSQRDTDNSVKPFLDALQLSTIISNDSRVHDINVERHYVKRDSMEAIMFMIHPVSQEDEDRIAKEKQLRLGEYPEMRHLAAEAIK